MSVPPTSEKGHSGGYESAFVPTGGRRKYAVSTPQHWAPELRFPESHVIYDSMRVESHLSGVLEAIAQPIHNADWHLVVDGVPQKVVDLVTTELGLNTEDQALAGVEHQGVNIVEHIREMSTTMLWAGFSCSEIIFNPDVPTPAQEAAGIDDVVVHLRKLPARHPRTITQIEVDRDGGLAAIEQTPLDGFKPKRIPVSQLVFYSLNKEGAEWQGRSVLRAAYRPWALKDIYTRIDAQAVEKHAMGYFHGTTSDPGKVDELYEKLAGLRAGEENVVVTGPHETVALIAGAGTPVDIIPRLNYLNQEMSRSALAMFMDLGHDRGAQNLAEVQLRVFLRKVQAVADYVGRIVTEHIIRELVFWNFPKGTPFPRLVPGDVAAQQGIEAEVLKMLMEAGAITYDRGLEDQTRARYGVTPLSEDADPAAGVPDPEQAPPAGVEPTTVRASSSRESAPLEYARELYAELERRLNA